MLAVQPVRAFADNYIWTIESPLHPDRVVVVDPGDGAPVTSELKRRGATLAAILLTHHHPDHIGGVGSLLKGARIPVIAPDDSRIPDISQVAHDGELIELPQLGLAFRTLHIPGHTLSHIAFWGHGSLFCGDTLFSAGCGRMFEGNAVQMHASLNRLRALPPDTRVYCGHEYTAANLRFALTVEPRNAAAISYRDRVKQLLDAGRPSLPSTLELEIQVNPFLRCEVEDVRAAAQRESGSGLAAPAEVFGALRAWKDRFR